jgi:hypothetical protein
MGGGGGVGVDTRPKLLLYKLLYLVNINVYANFTRLSVKNFFVQWLYVILNNYFHLNLS